MKLVDRPVDFYRRRLTRCAACQHVDFFDGDWYDRWGHGEESCPGCGVDCTEEQATAFVVNPEDEALNDSLVSSLSWWHTSTHQDWPSSNYDPAASLTAETIARMGGSAAAARWDARQWQKALHVGTFESAVHNMFRRMYDQGDVGSVFYLYRVRLREDIQVAPGLQDDADDFMGDVPLEEVCPPGVDVRRYLNEHEDRGSISLALGRTAVRSVQRLQLPLAALQRPPWWDSAVERLNEALLQPPPRPEPDPLERMRRCRNAKPLLTSNVTAAQKLLVQQRLAHFPGDIRDRAALAIPIGEDVRPSVWTGLLASLLQLIDQPHLVVEAVRNSPKGLVTPSVAGNGRPRRR